VYVLCTDLRKQRLLPQVTLSDWLLGAFEKFQKAAISFVMSVCLSNLSVCMEQLGSHWTNFREMLHLSTFCKSVEKI